MLLLNLLIGFVTELRAHRAMEALLGLDVARARVLRDGVVRDIDARELVAGDVIALEAGATVPADARLLHASELRTIEASLTGESVPEGLPVVGTVAMAIGGWPAWPLFTAFVGVNLIQSAFTRWCLMETILAKLGVRVRDFRGRSP